MLEISIHHEIRQRWIGDYILGLVSLEGIRNVVSSSERLDDEISNCVTRLGKSGGEAVATDRIERTRAAFRAMPNMDPSRYRPASEALIRRSIKTGFTRVNPMVDANNFLSIQLQVPIGLYDAHRLPTPFLTYRLGGMGETYTTIAGQEKSADGKLVLTDDIGVVGSPVTDSARALIGLSTAHAIAIAYLPFGTEVTEARLVIETIEDTFNGHFSVDKTTRRLLDA
jgi:DNA/RNA-binding domain of Phe-tRNA-synthetase-like protein